MYFICYSSPAGDSFETAEGNDAMQKRVFELLASGVPDSDIHVFDGATELPGSVADKPRRKSVLERLLDAGYPKSQVFHHYTDLYVFVTPLSKRVVEEWARDEGQRRPFGDNWQCSVFKDRLTGRKMFDVAFGFSEEVFRAHA